MKITAKQLIETAEYFVGYLEKKDGTAKYLTDAKSNFTANAGSANYTVFGSWFKSIKGIGNPNPWCAFFVSYCFYKATGDLNYAKELLGGDIYSYCPTGVNNFKAKKQWYVTNPKVGDVIFYSNGVRAYHTGIVYKVDSTRVYTIEGNTSSAVGVIENGGACERKSYPLSYGKILGYGRPYYEPDEKSTKTPTNATKKDDWISRLQKAIKAEVDNEAGEETLSKTPTIKRGDKGEVVKLLQEKLKALGYDPKGIDGNYGEEPYRGTYDAIIKYQKEVVGLKKPDGEFTAKGKSWKCILGIK